MQRTLEDLAYVPSLSSDWWIDPYRNFAAVAERDWIYRNDKGYEIVRYKPHQNLLRNRKLSQEHHLVAERAGIQDPDVKRFRTSFMIATVGDTHVRLRSSVAQFFGVQHVEHIRKDINALIHRIFDEVETDREIELYDTVCKRIPALTYLYLIGGDYGDEDFVARMSDSILKIFRADLSLREEIEGAYQELFEYVEGKISEREQVLSDDFLSHVLRQRDAGVLTAQEAFDMIVLTLEASTDNTSHQMAMVTSVFMEHPDQWSFIKEHPEILTKAVDEAIRYRPRSLSNSRVALEDLEWEGFSIPKGTEFFLSVLAANRDPFIYRNPNAFDIHREAPPPHQMFGGGMTVCLGSVLARMEIQEFFKVLIERYPNAVATKPTTFEYIPPVVAQTCGVHLVLEP
jgi:cytochrome P450